MKTRLAKREQAKIDRWLRDTARSRPWHQDPPVLVLSERSGLVEDAVEYLETLAHTVCELNAESNAAAFKVPADVLRDGILLIRKLNEVSVPDQQSIWASWLSRVQPGRVPKFALSFEPFDDEDFNPSYDVWDKLIDLGVIVSRSNTP